MTLRVPINLALARLTRRPKNSPGPSGYRIGALPL